MRKKMFELFKGYGEEAKRQLEEQKKKQTRDGEGGNEVKEENDLFFSELLEEEWKEMREAARRGPLREQVQDLVAGQTIEESGGGTSMLTQEKIFEIQKEKQMVVARMQERLRAIDHPEEHHEVRRPEARSVRYENGRYVWSADGEQPEMHVTAGVMVADVWWGNRYQLESDSSPRRDQKLYLLEEARADISRLLDKQLRRQVSGQLTRDKRRELSYRSSDKIVEEAIESGEITSEIRGFIAEKIIFTYLKALSIDYKAPFRVRPADVYQDSIQKVDMVIEVPAKDGNPKKRVGVQITISAKHAEQKRKDMEELKKEFVNDSEDGFDDMIVVHVPMRINSLVKRWKEDARPPGGPGRYIQEPQRLEMLSLVMKDVLPKNDVSELVKQMYS